MPDRELFTDFPLVSDTKPLNTDQFYKWLTDTEEFKPANTRQTRHNNFFEALDLYLKGYGYSKESHTLTGAAIKTLQYVFDTYQLMFTPIKPTAFHNLLRLTDDGGYWVQGKGTGERFEPTSLLRHALDEITLIYPVHPVHYYFQLSGDYLFIKYQSILGQRRLCKLTTTKTGAT